MPSAMTISNTIEFDSAKRSLIAQGANVNEEAEQQSLKYRLSSLLQSSLDLEQVLGIFFKELSEIVQLSGLSFTNDVRNLSFVLGKKSTHSCGYRMITELDHLGELTVYRGTRFTEKNLQFIEDTLSTLVSPLRNSLLYREALVASLTDPLTSAGNRLALENAFVRELELAKRHQSPLSLLVIDIDDFKLVNDTYGHKFGDEVLKDIVEKLKEVNRQTDLIFRFGGEEFVVVLNETSQQGAQVIAQRIRKKIESSPIKYMGESIEVTVSIGAASLKPNDSRDKLFQRADKALYQSKSNGKNTVTSL